MAKENPIGLFDFGIGGLSVAKQIKKMLPSESLLFLTDEVNIPFGQKSQAEKERIVFQDVTWFVSQMAKAVIIACNTATVTTFPFLQDNFPSLALIGTEPPIQAAAQVSQKGIAILSTTVTSQSERLSYLISTQAKGHKVFNIGSLKLAQAIENGSNPKQVQTILREVLQQSFLDEVDVLVLGCTHFPLVSDLIQDFVGPHIQLIEPGRLVAELVSSELRKKDELSELENPSYTAYKSDDIAIREMTTEEKNKIPYLAGFLG